MPNTKKDLVKKRVSARLGRLVAKLRKKQGLSRKDLSEKLGISQKELFSIEFGGLINEESMDSLFTNSDALKLYMGVLLLFLLRDRDIKPEMLGIFKLLRGYLYESVFDPNFPNGKWATRWRKLSKQSGPTEKEIDSAA